MTSDKDIKSRYTIEYINPLPHGAQKKKSHWLLFSVLGLVSLALIGGLIYQRMPISFSELLKIAPKTEDTLISKELKPKEEIVVQEKEALPNKSEETEKALTEVKRLSEARIKEQEKAKQQLEENKKLAKTLDELTQKLAQQKKKNKELSSKLNTQEKQNKQLSSMLEDALSKTNKEDKSYLSALSELDKKKEPKVQVIEQKELPVETVTSEEQKTEPEPEQEEKSVDYNNTVSLTTSSQVDAIIAAMGKNTKNTSTAKPQTENTGVVINQEASKQALSQKSPDKELLHIKLQKQINQLIISNKRNNNQYSDSLKKESEVRKNEVRSIVVRKGETLWSIAERAYGDGKLYKKIIKANPHLTKKGAIRLREGQVIRVPI